MKLKRKEVNQKKGPTSEFNMAFENFDIDGMKTTMRLYISECKWSASGLLMDCFLISALL